MSGTSAVGYFLFSIIFSFIVFILWARIALVFFKISPFLTLSQTIFRLTNPLLLPVHFCLSFVIRRKSRYDITALFAVFILEIIKYALTGLLFMQTLLPMALIVSLSLVSMIIEPCNFLFYAILARVILSWVSPTTYHPFIEFIYSITEPLLYRIRKMLPATAGLDFSPLIAIVLIKSITLFLTTSFPLAT
jgi:YggT family protein